MDQPSSEIPATISRKGSQCISRMWAVRKICQHFLVSRPCGIEQVVGLFFLSKAIEYRDHARNEIDMAGNDSQSFVSQSHCFIHLAVSKPGSRPVDQHVVWDIDVSRGLDEVDTRCLEDDEERPLDAFFGGDEIACECRGLGCLVHHIAEVVIPRPARTQYQLGFAFRGCSLASPHEIVEKSAADSLLPQTHPVREFNAAFSLLDFPSF